MCMLSEAEVSASSDGTIPGCDRMNENFMTNKMQGSGTEERVVSGKKNSVSLLLQKYWVP